MMGDECARPGIDVCQRMFSCFSIFQWIGVVAPASTPLASGPRNWGQSAAMAQPAQRTARKTHAARLLLMLVRNIQFVMRSSAPVVRPRTHLDAALGLGRTEKRRRTAALQNAGACSGSLRIARSVLECGSPLPLSLRTACPLSLQGFARTIARCALHPILICFCWR
jgi:hypothetical protein